MIACPRCSYENENSAMNCASCRINLQWALENSQEAARDNLQRVEGRPREAQAGNSVVRGFLVIVMLLAIPASGFLAFWNLLNFGFTPDSKRQLRSEYMAGVWFWLVVAVVSILAAIAVLLRRRPKPNLLPGLRILALIAVTGGLLFGLMRLTLVVLPEHTGRSLMIQYRLGERDFNGVNLEQADLHEARLRDADLSGADLDGANLTGANLYRAILREANLREADLTRAYLAPADLSGADLREADLSGAYLNGASLYRTDLRVAELTGANLSRAILREADLSQANLSGANLNGADLTGAKLTGATVTNEQFAGARSLEGATMPDGLVHE